MRPQLEIPLASTSDFVEQVGDMRVLLIGDDMRSFLACARSLGRQGIEVHAAPFNWSAPALSSKYVSEVHKLPRLGRSAKVWVNAVRELQAVHCFDLVIPCDERALIPLCAVPESKRNFKVAHPGDRALEFLFDKAKTRELAQELDIPVANGELADCNSNAQLLAAQFGLPVMFKARESYSATDLEDRGEVFAVNSVDVLDDELRALSKNDGVLIEQFFPKEGAADGIGVSVAARNGDILAAFQHRRLVEKPGGGSSSVRISEDLDPDMLAAVVKLSAATKLNGVAMFEFRQSVETKEWILLEVNARPWGSMPLPLALGVDFPTMLLDVHMNILRSYNGDYNSGVVGKNLVLTLLHKFQGRSKGAIPLAFACLGETITHIVNCGRGREVSDSFVWDDLRPGMFEFSALLKRGLNRIIWNKQGQPERRRGGIEIPAEATSSDVTTEAERVPEKRDIAS